ncbi:MAG: lipoyl synthase [Kiritimatiellae bacterium]|nr:lipoyl synthase [Kiritimatiellia bacterium]
MKRLPPWIRMDLRTDQHYVEVSQVLREKGLHTVCKSAKCPNRHACWNAGTATFMILGETCTRNCGFCGIQSGRPMAPDLHEAQRVADAAAIMKLRYVVVTSVTRDDLPDGGADHFAQVIRALRTNPGLTGVEVLTPDFNGSEESLSTVAEARPDVFNHNLETVRSLQQKIRPQASYRCSLDVLSRMAQRGTMRIKSGLMVGLGETDDEVLEAIHDLASVGCHILTVGQYLAPERHHYPVQRYVSPDVFDLYREEALKAGIRAVASAPLVRSSYRAAELMKQAEG